MCSNSLPAHDVRKIGPRFCRLTVFLGFGIMVTSASFLVAGILPLSQYLFLYFSSCVVASACKLRSMLLFILCLPGVMFVINFPSAARTSASVKGLSSSGLGWPVYSGRVTGGCWCCAQVPFGDDLQDVFLRPLEVVNQPLDLLSRDGLRFGLG